MRIEADAVIPFPRDLVYATYRDELPRLVDGIPRVRSIEVESRREDGDVVELVNVWTATGNVPKVIEKILPDVLSWHDHVRHDASTYESSWRIESHVFPEAVACTGKNVFVDLGGRTRFEMGGEIRIDVGRVKLVPELLVDGIAGAVERFMVRQITNSLVSVADALTEYLEVDRPRAGV